MCVCVCVCVCVCSVLQRMASINEPDTYWDIQTENPHAEECWKAMDEAVELQ